LTKIGAIWLEQLLFPERSTYGCHCGGDHASFTCLRANCAASKSACSLVKLVVVMGGSRRGGALGG
jgi:hypothetical protein